LSEDKSHGSLAVVSLWTNGPGGERFQGSTRVGEPRRFFPMIGQSMWHLSLWCHMRLRSGLLSRVRARNKVTGEPGSDDRKREKMKFPSPVIHPGFTRSGSSR